MFMELYKFSRLVMHLNSCSMDLGRDTLTQVIPVDTLFYNLHLTSHGG